MFESFIFIPLIINKVPIYDSINLIKSYSIAYLDPTVTYIMILLGCSNVHYPFNKGILAI